MLYIFINNNKQRKELKGTKSKIISLCGSTKEKLIKVYSFMTLSPQTYSETWLSEMEFYC